MPSEDWLSRPLGKAAMSCRRLGLTLLLSVAGVIACSEPADRESDAQPKADDGGAAEGEGEGRAEHGGEGEASEEGEASGETDGDDHSADQGEGEGEGEGGEVDEVPEAEVVGTGTEPDCLTGCVLWRRDYASEGGEAHESPAGIAIDAAGNAIMLVEVFGDDSSEFWLRAHSPDGELLWTRSVHRGSHAKMEGIAIGPDDSIAVISTETTNLGTQYETEGGTTVYDVEESRVAVHKYDPDGIPLWTRTTERDGPHNDLAGGVAFDGSGNVIVAGTLREEPRHLGDVTPTDFEIVRPWLRRYSPNGDELWTAPFADVSAGQGFGVATGPDDSVTFVGNGTVAGEDRLIVRRYTADGVVEWTRLYPERRGARVAVDVTGSVVVVGWKWGAEHFREIRRLRGDGDDIWLVNDEPPQPAGLIWTLDDRLAANSSGDLAVLYDLPRGAVRVRRRGPGGERVWTRQDPTARYMGAGGVAIDDLGYVYVAAWVPGPLFIETGEHFVQLLKYSP